MLHTIVKEILQLEVMDTQSFFDMLFVHRSEKDRLANLKKKVNFN